MGILGFAAFVELCSIAGIDADRVRVPFLWPYIE
jgi:hypothetical protein